MFPGQTAAIMVSSRPRYRRRGPVGFSALAGVGALGADPDSEAAIVQTALNQAYSGSGTQLVVDGVWGSKSVARMREYQAFLGLPVNGSQSDYAALVSLGIAAAVSSNGASASSNSSTATPSWAQSILDALSLKGVRDQLPTAKAVMDTVTLQSLRDLAAQDANAAATQAHELLKQGGDAAAAALKFLADNGNVIAGIALALGVSYSIAVALMLGGGGLVLILLLKGKR